MANGRDRLTALGVSGALALGTIGGAAVAGAGPAGATSSPTSVSFQFQASLTPPGGSATSVSGNGQLDLANDQAAASVNLPSSVAALLPGGSAAPTTLQAVLSGGTVYLSWPGLSGVTGGPAWVSFALPSGVQGGLPGAFGTISSALGDVNEIVQYAQSHGATVTSLGSNTVDGVGVTGTQLSWSPGSSAASASRHQGHTARGSKHQGHLSMTKIRRVERRLFGTSGPGVIPSTTAASLTATLWADANDELVQGVLQGTGSHGGVLSVQVDLSGYDAPVTITVPSSSDVLSVPFSVAVHYLDQVLGGDGQGGGGRGGCPGSTGTTPTTGSTCTGHRGHGDGHGHGDRGHGGGWR